MKKVESSAPQPEKIEKKIFLIKISRQSELFDDKRSKVEVI